MADTEWKTLRNGPIEKLEPNLWHVHGELPRMGIGRHMTIIKRADGALAIHSAIALDDAGMKELEAWGPLRWLIVPSGYHRMDAPRFKRRYPGLSVVCPPPARGRVARAVALDGDLSALPEDDGVRAIPLQGSRESVLRVVHPDGGVTLVFNDMLFNVAKQPPGLSGWMLRAIGSTGGPKVTQLARRFIMTDRELVAAHLRQLADTPQLRRLIPGHGDIVDRDPGGVLRRVADAV